MADTQTRHTRQTIFKTKEPSMHNVIMHNDDETTMDFVVMVLKRIFHKSEQDAEIIMLKIHNEGAAIVGTYYRDTAVSKAIYTMELAKKNSFPLKVTTEEA